MLNLKFTVTATIAAMLCAQMQAAEMTVDVTGVTSEAGSVRVAVFEEGAWLNGTPAASQAVDAAAPVTRLTFSGLAPGRYAISVFHDVDGDEELARGAMGIPKEPYGFSNDAPVRFGPPGFGKAAFDLTDAGSSQSIKLR